MYSPFLAVPSFFAVVCRSLSSHITVVRRSPRMSMYVVMRHRYIRIDHCVAKETFGNSLGGT